MQNRVQSGHGQGQGVNRQGQPRDYHNNHDQQGYYSKHPNQYQRSEYLSVRKNVGDDGHRGRLEQERRDRSITSRQDLNLRQSGYHGYSRDDHHKPRGDHHKPRGDHHKPRVVEEDYLHEGGKRSREEGYLKPPPEHLSSAPKSSDDHASPSVKKSRQAATGDGERMGALPGLPEPLLLPHEVGLLVKEQTAAVVAPSSFTKDIQLEEQERALPSTSKTFMMTTSGGSGHQQGTPSRPPSSSPPGLHDDKEGETTWRQQEDVGLEGLQQLQVDKEQGGATPPPAPCVVPLIQPAVTEPAAPLEAAVIPPPAAQGVAVPSSAGHMETGTMKMYAGPNGERTWHWIPPATVLGQQAVTPWLCMFLVPVNMMACQAVHPC